MIVAVSFRVSNSDFLLIGSFFGMGKIGITSRRGRKAGRAEKAGA
jgi:hypothetical protein